MMLNRAAARERTRLMKNRQLIQRADVDATKEVDDRREFMVSFRDGEMGFVARWEEKPYARSWSVVAELLG